MTSGSRVLSASVSSFPAILTAASLALTSCSPVYVAQSAAGHADLLLRRRSIAKAAKDERLSPEVRSRLEVAQDVRRFAFETLGLSRSRDFSTYVPLSRSAVTYIVSGSRKTMLEPYVWEFPFVGKFPYKGHFAKKRALREKENLERLGYDATVGGAAAYNTPLPFSDPLPSTALELSMGSLASLLIHELAHGTVYFKSQMAFNEAAAEFIGRRGAQEYLAARFGRDSSQLKAFEGELETERRIDAVFLGLRAHLERLYASSQSEDEKLRQRQPLFDVAGQQLAELGYSTASLNNASVLAHGLYNDDHKLFEDLLARCGGDWSRFLSRLRQLDWRRPLDALRLKTPCS